jgi:hypothetical protein
MHAKFYILLFGDFVRIVVTSANLTRGDFSGIVQSFWVQDFPFRKPSTNGNPAVDEGSGGSISSLDRTAMGRSFRYYLYSFLNELTLSPGFLDTYDFSSVKVELVGSIPGTHRSDQNTYGYPRIAALLSKYNVHTPPPEASSCPFKPITTESINDDDRLRVSSANRVLLFEPNLRSMPVYQSVSSIGNITHAWWQQFTQSVCGSSINSSTAPPPPPPSFCIVFPTVDCVCATEDSLRGKGVICLNRKAYEQPKFPRDCLRRYDSETAVLPNAYLSHAKILCQFNPCCGPPQKMLQYGWLITGSHNLSVSALGTAHTTAPEFYIGNYELSVFFPPSHYVLPSSSSRPVHFPIPFHIPAEVYSPTDIPYLSDFMTMEST